MALPCAKPKKPPIRRFFYFSLIPRLIVPSLCVGMHPVTLCVTFQKRNAERPWRRSHAERWDDRNPTFCL
ncbi:hypothetical protein CVG87_03145 [Pseudomonas sp. WCS365]|nr:hypothetical protein CVG87_03145 [Pseudomonas sp. WCS365]